MNISLDNLDGSVAGYSSDQDGFLAGFVRDKYANFTKIDTPGQSLRHRSPEHQRRGSRRGLQHRSHSIP